MIRPRGEYKFAIVTGVQIADEIISDVHAKALIRQNIKNEFAHFIEFDALCGLTIKDLFEIYEIERFAFACYQGDQEEAHILFVHSFPPFVLAGLEKKPLQEVVSQYLDTLVDEVYEGARMAFKTKYMNCSIRGVVSKTRKYKDLVE